MINVSQDFITATNNSIMDCRLEGVFNFYGANGELQHSQIWTDKNLLKDSFKINSQAISGSGFGLGGVVSKELTAIFLYTDIDFAIFIGASIEVSYGLNVNGNYQWIKMGRFTITNANDDGFGRISITACDDLNFVNRYDDETDLMAKYLISPQQPYDILNTLLNRAGLTLGNTLAEIQNMPNGTTTFNVLDDCQISATSDYLSYIAQCLSAFCTTNQDGNITLKNFGNTIDTPAVPVYTLIRRRTYNDTQKISTVVNAIIAIQMSVYQNGGQAWWGKEYTQEQPILPTDITITMDDNPFLEGLYYRSSDMLEPLGAIRLQTVSFWYRPFSLDYVNAPFLEVGDAIYLEKADGTLLNSVITHSVFTFRGKHTIKCVGDDTRLSAGVKRTEIKRLEEKMNKRVSSVAGVNITQEEFDNLSNNELKEGKTYYVY